MKKAFIISSLLVLLVGYGSSTPNFDNVVLPDAKTIYAIAQDDDGITWFGTEKGLYSFDGYHTTPHFAFNEVESTHIYALTIRDNIIFLGTERGLLKYDIAAGGYVSAGEGSPQYIRAITIHEGRMLFGAAEGVWAYDAQAGQYYRVAEINSNVYSLLSLRGVLYAGTTDGLYTVQEGIAEKAVIPGSSPLVNALIPCADGKSVWAGTEGELYRYEDGRFLSVAQLHKNSVKTLLETEYGMFAGTDAGLFIIDGQNITRLLHDTGAATSIASNIIWTLYRDRWGNIWTGTDNGLSILPQRRFSEFVPIDAFTGSGIGNSIYAVTEDSAGGLWMGGTNGLIHVPAHAHNNGTVVWYRQDTPEHPLPHNRVRRVREDNEGNILVCTDQGVSVIYRDAGRMHNFIACDSTGRFSCAWAYDIVDDLNGNYWIASYQGGIFVVGKEQIADGRITARKHFLDELSSENVIQLLFDRRHRIWASLAGRGVDIIDPATMQVSHMSDISVTALSADNEGSVWAGGYGYAERFAAGSDSISGYDLSGKHGAYVTAAAAVGGDIWMFRTGECLVMNAGGIAKRYILPMRDIYSAYYSPNERIIYLGCDDGFLKLDTTMPGGVKNKILLSDIFVNDQRYVLPDSDIRYASQITLKSDENHIRLLLTDIPYDGLPSTAYAYMLKGIDSDWHGFTDNRPEIKYNGLPYGSYTLEIAVPDGSTKTADTAFRLKIRILPPWYLTVWAKIAYLLLAAMAAAGIARHYAVRRRLRQERLARQNSLEQSDLRMRFFEQLATDLSNPLSQIITLVSGLLKDERNDKLELIRESSQKLNKLIERSLSFKIGSSAFASYENGDDTADSQDEKFIREITAAIEANLSDSDFNVSKLQECAGLGSKLIYRKIKQITGLTPVEYIRDIRMCKAALLLDQGRFSISEVMYMVGFSNSSYFSKCFQKRFDKTPKEYAAATKLKS